MSTTTNKRPPLLLAKKTAALDDETTKDLSLSGAENFCIRNVDPIAQSMARATS